MLRTYIEKEQTINTRCNTVNVTLQENEPLDGFLSLDGYLPALCALVSTHCSVPRNWRWLYSSIDRALDLHLEGGRVVIAFRFMSFTTVCLAGRLSRLNLPSDFQANGLWPESCHAS